MAQKFESPKFGGQAMALCSACSGKIPLHSAATSLNSITDEDWKKRTGAEAWTKYAI
ncbi:MAG: hypothetical protein AABZ14_00970 [Candidatus Margulisiibacteriota bacterium]